MIRLLTSVSILLFSTHAITQIAVPKEYVDGEVIKADDLNANLRAIADAVPPRNCTTNQIIKWNAANSEWVCTDDPFASLDCNEGDSIKFENGSWVCFSTNCGEHGEEDEVGHDDHEEGC